MRNTLLSSLLFSIVLLGTSCGKDDPDPVPNPNVVFRAVINAAGEVPTNASTATGTATLTFNANTKIFTVNIQFAGLTATAAHIHKAAVGVNGPVVFGFSTPITSPINYTSAALNVTQEADLNANLFYVNIHSAAFPGGEIRGQLIKQ